MGDWRKRLCGGTSFHPTDEVLRRRQGEKRRAHVRSLCTATTITARTQRLKKLSLSLAMIYEMKSIRVTQASFVPSICQTLHHRRSEQIDAIYDCFRRTFGSSRLPFFPPTAETRAERSITRISLFADFLLSFLLFFYRCLQNKSNTQEEVVH